MPRYQVPQFIGTESKIVGPFTFKQFIYLLAGAVVIYFLQFFVSLSTLIIAAVPIGLISVGLAFLKIDGTPLPQYIAMSIAFLFGNKQYIYKNAPSETETSVQNILKKP